MMDSESQHDLTTLDICVHRHSLQTLNTSQNSHYNALSLLLKYLTDLAPSDFRLFGPLKESLGAGTVCIYGHNFYPPTFSIRHLTSATSSVRQRH